MLHHPGEKPEPMEPSSADFSTQALGIGPFGIHKFRDDATCGCQAFRHVRHAEDQDVDVPCWGRWLGWGRVFERMISTYTCILIVELYNL